MFNPIVNSLRGIQQASELAKVQKKLGCQRASLGSLSEATEVFNPELLKEIISELGEQLQPISADSRLKDISQTITLVDGTLLTALPQMMEASVRKESTGSGMVKWRLHTHFEVAKNWPVRMDLAPNGGGDNRGDNRGQAISDGTIGDRPFPRQLFLSKIGLPNGPLFYPLARQVRIVWLTARSKILLSFADLTQIFTKSSNWLSVSAHFQL